MKEIIEQYNELCDRANAELKRINDNHPTHDELATACLLVVFLESPRDKINVMAKDFE